MIGTDEFLKRFVEFLNERYEYRIASDEVDSFLDFAQEEKVKEAYNKGFHDGCEHARPAY